MILLTKLDKQKILINLETVKYLEAVPDTIIFFTNGDSVMVQESIDDIAQAVLTYQSSVLRKSMTGLAEVPPIS
ncbi:MAG: flagellar FlbD family protein [Proteobacteria bacterium]|nr:flagellar FlbD family protein [Pseudomonadota bacterium]